MRRMSHSALDRNESKRADCSRGQPAAGDVPAHRSVALKGARSAVVASLCAASLVLASPLYAKSHKPPKSPPGQSVPLTIVASQDLSFGIVGGDATLPGSATIDPASGTKTVAGGACDFGGIHSPAAFAISGQKNTTYTITLPGSVTLTSAGNTLTLNAFTSSPNTVGIISNNGKGNTVLVGATLHLAANQAAGTYSGVFDVTVNY